MKRAAVILAAGKGKRMKSELPKVLHRAGGRTLIEHVVHSIKAVRPDRIYVVVGHGAAEVVRAVGGGGVEFVVQEEQLGTGHAVLQCEKNLADFDGTVIVLNGDVPALRAETIESFIRYHEDSGSCATVLTAVLENPEGYGRIVKDDDGKLMRIVEEKDASGEERAIKEINAGLFCFAARELYAALKDIGRDNAQREYYLTDVVGIMRSRDLPVSVYCVADAREVAGVNTPDELEEMDRYLRSMGK